MTTISRRSRAVDDTVPEFARRRVLGIAAAVGLLLLVTAGRYGYFGDELYFLAAGRHLDWGYAEQPPLLPLLAHVMDSIAPGSVTVLRLPAIAVTAAGVAFAALIARELGGATRAQLLTAGAYAVSAQLLGTGHYLATSTMDPFLWTVLLWLLVRWVRTRRDTVLIWAGVVTAVAVNVKFLTPVFWLAVGCAALAVGPRELLRRKNLWFGAGITVLAALPTVIWQSRNGWPQLEMSAAISREVTAMAGGRLMYLPVFLASVGLLVGAVLFGYGLTRLLRSEHLRPYRFLGWAAIGIVLVFLVVNGRSYYAVGIVPICWAAAAVEIEAIPRTTFAGGETNWPEVVDSIAAAYRALPRDRREHTAVVTESYWDAAAIDQYGAERGIDRVYSGNRGYWTLGTPPASADSVLYVGEDPSPTRQDFRSVTRVGAVDAGPAPVNFSHGKPIWFAAGITSSWDRAWPAYRRMN